MKPVVMNNLRQEAFNSDMSEKRTRAPNLHFHHRGPGIRRLLLGAIIATLVGLLTATLFVPNPFTN